MAYESLQSSCNLKGHFLSARCNINICKTSENLLTLLQNLNNQQGIVSGLEKNKMMTQIM